MKDKKKIMADENFCSNGLDIAIVGYSCRFPKAKGAEEYWKNLINGVDCVSEISNDKWDVDEFYSKDVNDSEKCAKQLAHLLKGLNCYVNLIPYNETSHIEFKKTENREIMKFYDILKKNNINVTVRREFGSEVDAACGQLRSNYKEEV